MFIDIISRQHYENFPLTAVLSDTNSDISTRIQSVSNTPPSSAPSCFIGIACGAVMAASTYYSGKIITNAVYDLNNFSALEKSGSQSPPQEIVNLGVEYGALGGFITGLSAAMILRQCIKISNRQEFYANHKNILLFIGGSVGIGFGGLVGALYSIALNHWITMNDSYD
ncbi:hypothetical protein ABK905_02350 [Acerihabitans sp. KWT182]|uniref:Uncharacterized protein n=1 Tax=Acerihabitans sp. KWT182 TaxID=3157919 RepID=A0AAU7QAV8_9GAMM